YEIFTIPQGDRTLILKSGSFELSRATINLQSWDYFLDFNYPEVDVPIEFTDHRDGNVYLSMEIGNQTWMLGNLKYLPAVHSPREESTTDPMYYVYWYWGNDVSEAKDSMYYDLFGVAYNWPAAMKACPSGWHLPTDAEWNELQIYLGMNPSEEEVHGCQHSGNVGHKLKSTEGWEDCWNGTEHRGDNGNNSSNMNIKPSGGKGHWRGFYLPDVAVMWTSTEFDSTMAWKRAISPSEPSVSRTYNTKLSGNFIRCVKD
ncbi:MAG: fibrobacter succinogenes major paralogous domain-containing protein, partial [Bacteroidota bacterium]|nr:fibrobacter succinogenes major paralogous domain-containing protein [Bacteroidota bacterium]